MSNNLSSYVFKCDKSRLPLPDIENSDVFIRMAISDDEITIQLNSLIADGSNAVSEKRITERVVSLHTNSSGDKYLMVSISDSPEDYLSWGLDVLQEWVTSGIGMPDEYMLLVNRTIGDWFGNKYKLSQIEEMGLSLSYPAVRTHPVFSEVALEHEDSHRAITSLTSLLGVLVSRSGKIEESLRNNSNWESFIRDVTNEKHDSLIARDAIREIAENPSLLEFAVLNTGKPFSVLHSHNAESIRLYSNEFKIFDRNALHFMQEFLPEEMKPSAVQLILDVLNKWRELSKSRRNVKRVLYPTDSEFAEVPDELRPTMAMVLYESLKSTHTTFLSNMQRYNLTPTRHIPLSLQDVFYKWFSENVFEPLLQSSVTEEGIRERYANFFGAELPEDVDFFITEHETVFCHLWWKKDSPEHSFMALYGIVTPNLPKNVGIGAEKVEYIGPGGYFVEVDGRMYSLDAMMTILQRGFAKVDAALNNLKRAITAENRLAYVMFDHPDRDCEDTWYYYDLGVTDTQKVISLKYAGITEEEEIIAYAALPTDMFYEIIALRIR